MTWRADGRPAPVTDLTGATHRPLVLSDRFLRDARRRLMVAGPPAGIRELIDRRRRIEGIPLDVILLLDAIGLLAEGGNKIAADLVYRERRRWGIDVRKYG